jgi:hypothetical protein
MGLTERYSSTDQRFEVDGANTARDFLKSYGVPQRDIEDVWIAIALHTTPGIPQHMRPTIALVTAGVEMDVLGIAYDVFPGTSSSGLRMSSARSEFQGKHNRSLRQRYHTKALTTFGNVKADVLALKDPTYRRMNFCSIILGSQWPD